MASFCVTLSLVIGCLTIIPGFKNRHTGFTLPEMTVSVFLLSLVMLLTVGAFIPGLKISRQAEESIASQREIVLSYEKLFAELELMDRLSVTTMDGGLSYLSHRSYSGTNPVLDPTEMTVFGFSSLRSVWKKFVVLRLRDRRLLKREYPYAGGSVLARVNSDDLLNVADSPGREEKVFARDIEEFKAGTVGLSRLEIRLRSVNRGARTPEACDVTFQIAMRGTNG